MRARYVPYHVLQAALRARVKSHGHRDGWQYQKELHNAVAFLLRCHRKRYQLQPHARAYWLGRARGALRASFTCDRSYIP